MKEKYLKIFENLSSIIFSYVLSFSLLILTAGFSTEAPEDDYSAMWMAFVLFLVSLKAFFEYFKINKKLIKTSRTIIKIGFAYSYSLYWLILMVNEGTVSGLTNVFYFIFGLILPVTLFMVYKNKILIYKEYFYEKDKIENEIKAVVEKEEEIKEVEKFSLDNLNNLYVKMKKTEVKNRFSSILWDLEEIIKKQDNLSFEQSHNIERMINKDLYNLLEIYNELSDQVKKDSEKIVLEKLNTIDKYLKMIKKGISSIDLMELEKQMNLIDQRYEKKK